MKKRFAASTVLLSTALVLGSTTAWAASSTATIEFTSNGAPVVVDPDVLIPDSENPYLPPGDNEPTYETGPLTLDFVSNFDFGANELVFDKEEFKATNQKPFLQVTDRRDILSKWDVKVKLGKFADKNGNESLTGSILTINPGVVQTLKNVGDYSIPTTKGIVLKPGGDEETILTAEKGTFSTWQVYWKGNGETNDFIKIDIPVNEQTKGKHIATMEWTLSDVVN